MPWEGHVLRRVMGDTAADILKRHPHGTDQVLEVARQVGAGNIIFEASSMTPYAQWRAQQFWLVRLFGPDVNMGNVRLEEVQYLEHIRLGTWPVFGFGPPGNHPFMQALERTQGAPPTDTWWQAIPLPRSPAPEAVFASVRPALWNERPGTFQTVRPVCQGLARQAERVRT